jgi:hypothetical protein
MRHHRSIAAIAASAFLLAATPLRADNDAAKIAVGAAAIHGVAALAHQNQHHKDDKHHNTAEKEAVYERGFQDGLHNASYHPDPNHESSYREGYDAGADERKLRTGHYRDHEWEQDRHAAPRFAMQTCVGEVSSSTNINPRDITPVTSRRSGSDYLVEVASGYRHYTCTVDGDGEVRGMRNGSI